ncbi:related to ECM39 protein, involved in cell wall biogenesis and architecture [Rhynchosporium agropyri]|uniref:Mannosyltransferase n=1 Tax=Rhynchosporium agropyri TaxID=914238 RepID=A0A1E1K8Y6_9HELO|nr:related to ECM39 protein, involved in cell wall biogenesis and architecture [Rhynchosporium agropyri]
MEPIDVCLLPVIPAVVLLHLLVAPYTKVEESFNIQATHDIITYGIPLQNTTFLQSYDHFTFPGAVPRTFVGALALAGYSIGAIRFLGEQYSQLVVRGFLGLFNAVVLYNYALDIKNAFGRDVSRWYILLQASQFHVMFYASRTLPNMFAFGLTTLAFNQFLPLPGRNTATVQKKQQFGIFLFVLAGVIFRSEVALLLFSQLSVLLLQSQILLQPIIQAGIMSAIVALGISVPIDSFFWQKPIWPELAGFYYNAIQGKSADWGTSPLTFYFANSLPRLLLNPFILILIPLASIIPSTRYPARGLVIPSLLFITIYSLQPHKESRFIIYVVPPLTGAASLSASYIWTRRTKSFLYSFGSIILLGSIAASCLVSTIMLLISSLNYPGGDALIQLHDIIETSHPSNTYTNTTLNIHLDVLSCMTGITHFLETTHLSPTLHLHYDKTESPPSTLLDPSFWSTFDYALMEEPGKAIGKWEVVRTVFAYSGIEILKPGDGSSFSENLERVYQANNLTKASHQNSESDENDARIKGDSVLSSEEIQREVERLGEEKEKIPWDEEKEREKREMANEKTRLLLEEMGRFGTFRLVRDAVRVVTGGYWIGPRMEPKIRILRRVKD